MANHKPRICLSMIVKNEAPVIERCLASLRQLINAWVIVDTGSSDGTQALVREALRDLPGELHERPWVDFATNRTQALQLARPRGEFLFVIDADETLQWPADFQWPALTADLYSLTMQFGTTHYHRPCLLRAALDWHYRGVLHEYLDCTEPFRSAHLAGPSVWVRAEGARSRNPRKFHDDAELLRRALLTEPDNARYRFYLAQSYRDAGELTLAIEHYRRRASMGGWDEEVWYASFQIAVLLERLAAAPAEIAQAYLNAFQLRPTRAEPLVELARWHRLRGEHALALLYARPAAQLACPDDRLFVDAATYAWRALDELAVAAWWAAARAEGAAAMRRLLSDARFPESDRARIHANAACYRDAGFSIDA